MTEAAPWARKATKRYRLRKPEAPRPAETSHIADSRVYNSKVGRTGQAGAWAEMMAAAWLIEKGFDVFRNVAQHGPADLVALSHGRVQLFDVKLCAVTFGRDGQPKINLSNRLSDRQIQLGVAQFFVTSDGVCGFDAQTIRDTYRRTYLLRGPMAVRQEDA